MQDSNCVTEEPTVQQQSLKERFVGLVRGIDRDGIFDLLDWLEKSDFYISPASTRFHGSYQGGLLEHSLNVYDEFTRLLSVYPEIHVSEETKRIVTLFHDLCKVNMYVTEQRNRKNEFGVWEKVDVYATKEKFCFGGHGSKSVYIVQNFIKLKPDEAVAINCHMGAFQGDVRDIGNAFEQFPLAWLLSVADQSATFIRENSGVTH